MVRIAFRDTQTAYWKPEWSQIGHGCGLVCDPQCWFDEWVG